MQITNTYTFCDKCFKQIKMGNYCRKLTFSFDDEVPKEKAVVLCPKCYDKVREALTFEEFSTHEKDLNAIKKANGSLKVDLY